MQNVHCLCHPNCTNQKNSKTPSKSYIKTERFSLASSIELLFSSSIETDLSQKSLSWRENLHHREQYTPPSRRRTCATMSHPSKLYTATLFPKCYDTDFHTKTHRKSAGGLNPATFPTENAHNRSPNLLLVQHLCNE